MSARLDRPAPALTSPNSPAVSVSAEALGERSTSAARSLAEAASDDLYPPWQGMQYLENMFGGKAKLDPLDNRRYGRVKVATARDVLSDFVRST